MLTQYCFPWFALNGWRTMPILEQSGVVFIPSFIFIWVWITVIVWPHYSIMPSYRILIASEGVPFENREVRALLSLKIAYSVHMTDLKKLNFGLWNELIDYIVMVLFQLLRPGIQKIKPNSAAKLPLIWLTVWFFCPRLFVVSSEHLSPKLDSYSCMIQLHCTITVYCLWTFYYKRYRVINVSWQPLLNISFPITNYYQRAVAGTQHVLPCSHFSFSLPFAYLLYLCHSESGGRCSNGYQYSDFRRNDKAQLLENGDTTKFCDKSHVKSKNHCWNNLSLFPANLNPGLFVL